MNSLKVGFGRVNATPMMGIALDGYFMERRADGVLDDLEINALALEAGGSRAVLLTLDNCGTNAAVLEPYRRHIAEVTGIPFEAVLISCTHSHNAPILDASSTDPLENEYRRSLYHKMADAAAFAVADLQEAKMGWAVGSAPNIAFVRRFRMKDGGIRTNPGVGNPDILAPIGDVDERLNVIRFDRADGQSYVLVNFGNHPDTVGGCKISGDWPTLMRHCVEQAIDNTRCIFFNGAQGDVNHVNVNAKDGDLNDLANDFDDVARGYGHTRHMARVMTGAVLQVFDKVNYRDVDTIRFAQKVVDIPSNMPKPEDMPLARKYNELHLAGKDEEIPFKGMELTTVVAEAGRMVDLEHGPASFPLLLSAISFGSIAMLGIPGEPFTGIGRGLKQAQGWELVLPCCQTNDRVGYFPMQEAYDEGGYEARSSIFAAGVAERIIEEGTALLSSLR